MDFKCFEKIIRGARFLDIAELTQSEHSKTQKAPSNDGAFCVYACLKNKTSYDGTSLFKKR